MADLLGSILGSMEKPPTLGAEERRKAKEEKTRREKIQRQEKEKLNNFRAKTQKAISDFIKDSNAQKYKFQAMSKVYRAILHEVADIAGLASFSFGEEEVDRYVMVWKKEFAPCDDELLAYRNGQKWDPEAAKALAEQKKLAAQESAAKREEINPNTNYQEKYQRLIGTTAAKAAAQSTSTNRAYGVVSSENKRDRRTIEEVMAESRARKKLKADEESTNSSTTGTSDRSPHRTDHDKDDNKKA